MRAAWPAATLARHAFHCNGGNPSAARSWLIKPNWPLPLPATLGAGGTGAGRAVARGGGLAARRAGAGGVAGGGGSQYATSRCGGSVSGARVGRLVTDAECTAI